MRPICKVIGCDRFADGPRAFTDDGQGPFCCRPCIEGWVPDGFAPCSCEEATRQEVLLAKLDESFDRMAAQLTGDEIREIGTMMVNMEHDLEHKDNQIRWLRQEVRILRDHFDFSGSVLRLIEASEPLPPSARGDR